jgi:outer membrane biosynthesis protein TonB
VTLRAERTGLGISAAAHVALFGILSLGFLAAPQPLIIPQAPLDVQLVDEVGLEAASPTPATEAPAPSIAPEVAPPEPEAPPPEAVAPPKPAPVVTPTPSPKPAPVKAVAKSAPPKTVAKPTPPRGSRLGNDFLKGISDQQSASTSQTPRTVKVGAQEMASLVAAIRRQVQPCADRINNPGPGANAISTKLNLRLNQDGSFAARPVVLSQSGVDDENSRYAKRVGELAASAFVQCAPFELPAELYEGWKNFNLNYKLPD